MPYGPQKPSSISSRPMAWRAVRRDGKVRIATFSKGNLLTDETKNTEEENGTYIFFEPDNTLFLNY